MKLKPLLLIGLFAGGITACHKKADAAKTAAQAAADQKAVTVRAAADQKITAQNDAAKLKTAVLKEAAAKKTVEAVVPATPVIPAVHAPVK